MKRDALAESEPRGDARARAPRAEENATCLAKSAVAEGIVGEGFAQRLREPGGGGGDGALLIDDAP